jgi:hypothetical protein
LTPRYSLACCHGFSAFVAIGVQLNEPKRRKLIAGERNAREAAEFGSKPYNIGRFNGYGAAQKAC